MIDVELFGQGAEGVFVLDLCADVEWDAGQTELLRQISGLHGAQVVVGDDGVEASSHLVSLHVLVNSGQGLLLVLDGLVLCFDPFVHVGRRPGHLLSRQTHQSTQPQLLDTQQHRQTFDRAAAHQEHTFIAVALVAYPLIRFSKLE